MKVIFCVVISILTGVYTQDTAGTNRGGIYLDGGKYKGVLVAVDQAVEYSEDVLSHLKVWLSILLPLQ